MNKIVIRLSAREAEQFMPMQGDVCLSLMNPEEPAKLQPGWTAIERLYFHDAEYTHESLHNDCGTGRKMYPAQHGFIVPAQAIHIRKVLGRWLERADVLRIVVHCHAGQRRSGAVCQYLHEGQHRVELEQGLPDDPNRTVLNLLRDPGHYGAVPVEPILRRLFRTLLE